MEKPLISIITVCYNAIHDIERTILSVINQTYPNIEYIIIDGGSIDGTLDVIKKFKSNISLYISEPDKGIYDAMNKGIKLASGKWINFMNAGDIFYDNDVVYNIFNLENEFDSFSVVYGKTEFIYSHKREIIGQKNHKLYKIMPSCHQSIFCKTDALKAHPFNLKYKYAADLDFFNHLHKKYCKYKYVDIIVASYDAVYGVSSSNAYECQKEVLSILYPIKIQYYLYIFVYIIKQFIKKILY